ncbi:hypothetical protein A6S26_02780 [Nostoc sp. ATCC 43529]|nr:hypothetical protein A6S26_02780 [Nostoc sp. ATCC 43529]
MQKFECLNTIFGQVSKSQNWFLQHLFTTCPNLQVSRLYPYGEASYAQRLVEKPAKGIALSRKLILLTRNHRDFSKVSGLLIEDWMI